MVTGSKGLANPNALGVVRHAAGTKGRFVREPLIRGGRQANWHIMAAPDPKPCSQPAHMSGLGTGTVPGRIWGKGRSNQVTDNGGERASVRR